MTTEAPRLKEMSKELSKRLRRFGGTWSKQDALRQEALGHIRLALDREQAFASIRGNGQSSGKKSGAGEVGKHAVKRPLFSCGR